jgi:hypothetical protein
MPGKINNMARNLAADGTLNRADVKALITAAQDGPKVTDSEKAALNNVLSRYADSFDADAKNELMNFLNPDAAIDAKIAANPRGDYDKDGLTNAKELKLGTDPKLADTDADGLFDGVEVNKYKLDPKDAQNTVESTEKPWTTTYWPMAGNSSRGIDGAPRTNLWATDGALDKLDKLNGARGNDDGAKALDFERKPALNWLVGDGDKGHYIPRSSLQESNAEMTTGVDFDGDGKLTKGVKADFLNARSDFAAVVNRGAFVPKLGDDVLTKKIVDGENGEKNVQYFKADGTKIEGDDLKNVVLTNPQSDGSAEGTMNVGWWGSCDKVALAGILFSDPKRDVEVDGVTFTKQDIRGLLTVIADSQTTSTDFVGSRYDEKQDIVVKKDGTQIGGKIIDIKDKEFKTEGMWRWSGDYMVTDGSEKDVTIRTSEGKETVVAASEIKHLAREDKQDIDPGVFHTTVKNWLGSGKGAAMDRDSGSHVWNYNFHKAEIAERSIENFNRDEAIGHNGKAGDGELRHYGMKLYFDGSPKNYSYWLEYKEGDIVNGGWKGENPDFLWRPADFKGFTGTNSRNPFVDPALVKEIYEKSIADEPVSTDVE